ncbi:MAG TPA: hypothetical protein VEI83_09795, partial [Acidimicrobiales bacterium]|nr:hypothetical protein [Acidimicrobiales bacterium]
MTAIPATGRQVRVEGVLLAGETPDGPALVSIEALVVDERGLTIMGPRPGSQRVVPWSEVSGFSGTSPASLPTGEPAAALSLEVRGRALRFLLPGAQVGPVVVAELRTEITRHVGADSPAAATPASPASPGSSAPPVAAPP